MHVCFFTQKQIIMKIIIQWQKLTKLWCKSKKSLIEWFWQVLAWVRLADSHQISKPARYSANIRYCINPKRDPNREIEIWAWRSHFKTVHQGANIYLNNAVTIENHQAGHRMTHDYYITKTSNGSNGQIYLPHKVYN